MHCRLGTILLLPLLVSVAPAVAEEIPLRIAGELTAAEVVRQDSEILLHLTPLLGRFGIQSVYNPDDESITLTPPTGLPLRAVTGKVEVRVGEETKLLACAPQVIEGKSYFPLYSLARLLGLYVREDAQGVLTINAAVTRIAVMRNGLEALSSPEAASPESRETPAVRVPASPPAGTVAQPKAVPGVASAVGSATSQPAGVHVEVAPTVAAPTTPWHPTSSTHEESKLVIEVGAPVKYTVKTLSDPFRVYVDLQHTNLMGGSGDRYRGGGDLQLVRASQFSYDPDTVRVVAEFASEVPYRVETKSPGSRVEVTFNAVARPNVRLLSVDVEELSPTVSRVRLKSDGFSAYQQSVLRAPSRVVLDLADTDASAAVVAPVLKNHRLLSAIRVANQAEPAGTARVVVELKQMTAMTVGRTSAQEIAIDLVTSPLSKKIVVVDAGHGGHDPGAQYGKVQEKDLVLDIAKRVHARLVKRGVTALMTRADDTFVSLSDRCEFANRVRADLFVSIHLNAAARANKSSGTEVYYYTDRSLPFAIAMHDKLLRATGLNDGGVRKHMLYVVHHTNMPSVLTETCYLNNDAEFRLATDPAFRQRVADAMFEAIRAYVEGPKVTMDKPASTAPSTAPKDQGGAAVSTVAPTGGN